MPNNKTKIIVASILVIFSVQFMSPIVSANDYSDRNEELYQKVYANALILYNITDEIQAAWNDEDIAQFNTIIDAMYRFENGEIPVNEALSIINAQFNTPNVLTWGLYETRIYDGATDGYLEAELGMDYDVGFDKITDWSVYIGGHRMYSDAGLHDVVLGLYDLFYYESDTGITPATHTMDVTIYWEKYVTYWREGYWDNSGWIPIWIPGWWESEWQTQSPITWSGASKYIDDDDKNAPSITLTPTDWNTIALDSELSYSRTFSWSVSEDNSGDDSGVTVSVKMRIDGGSWSTISTLASSSYTIPSNDVGKTYEVQVSATDHDNDRSGDALTSSKTARIQYRDDDTTSPSIVINGGSWEQYRTIYDNVASIPVSVDANDASSINSLYVYDSFGNPVSGTTTIDDDGTAVRTGSINFGYPESWNNGDASCTYSSAGATFSAECFDGYYNPWAIMGEYEGENSFSITVETNDYTVPALSASEFGYGDGTWTTSISSAKISFGLQMEEITTTTFVTVPVTLRTAEGDCSLDIQYRVNSGAWTPVMAHLVGDNDYHYPYANFEFSVFSIDPSDVIQFRLNFNGQINPYSSSISGENVWKRVLVDNVQLQCNYAWSYTSVPSYTIAVNNNLGVHSFRVVATDNDNDRTNDRLTSNNYYYYNVVDDDEVGPNINIFYSGDGTDGNIGKLYINANDPSGVNRIVVGGIPYYTNYVVIDLHDGAGLELDTSNIYTYQYISVVAYDNDNDRSSDSASSSKTWSIKLIDDDVLAPDITYIYTGDGTDINAGTFQFLVNDPSGYTILSGTTEVQALPTVAGNYTYSIQVRDLDQDCLASLRTDYMESSRSVTIEIKYVDQEPPVVTATYIGGYTDGNSGYIDVVATDNLGLSVDPSGMYPLDPSVIDSPQHFTFTAVDLYENVGTASISVTLSDDDTIEPSISATYFGDYTDGNAGYIQVTAFDASGLFTDPSGIYYLNPAIIGIPQIFLFSATDNDNDRFGDRLSRSIQVEITLVDDDTTVDITDIQILISLIEITVVFTDIDYSGIASCDWVTVDGELVDFDYLTNVFTFENEWVLSLGMHTIEFQLTDADNDRPGDATSATFSIAFEITDDLVAEYLYGKIYELRQMIVDDMPSDCWKQAPNGNGNGKGKSGLGDGTNPQYAMLNKLDELEALIADGMYTEAYNKMVHDIKPKLTAITLEGNFNNPWVICESRQQDYIDPCDAILSALGILI